MMKGNTLILSKKDGITERIEKSGGFCCQLPPKPA